MVVMAEYLTQDRLSELRHHINQLHYSYLVIEDSPQKIDQRNKLEAYIKEYLCLVPPQHKFSFRETADVLHRSASCKKDFSGYRAALGWNAISMYAGNLLAQPWRKEYRTIKLYSGFYKHEIEANLVGAEIMLEVMGYKHVGDSVMVLEGPICPDQVTNVSCDSLLAFVECQIIKSIWEELSSHFKITWLQVLEFREKHTCSPDQAVRAMSYRLHEQERCHSVHHSTMQPLSPTVAQPIYSNPMPPHVIDAYSRYAPLVVQAPAQPPPNMYGTVPYYGYTTATYGATNNYPTMPHQRYPQYPPLMVSSKSNMYSAVPSNNGYCYPYPPQNGGYVTPHNSGYTVQQARTVPTGQLIELDGGTPYQHQDTVIPTKKYTNNLIETTNHPSSPRGGVREEGTGTFESWDFVFKNLESQGYSKDMGQRGDLLSPDSKKSSKRSSRENRNRKISDVLQQLKLDGEEYDNKVNVAHSSSYDNLSSHSSSNNKAHHTNYTTAMKTKSLPRESKSYEDRLQHQTATNVSQTLDPKKVRNKIKTTAATTANTRHKDGKKDEVDAISKPLNADKWHCSTCTYLNSPTTDICEMCSKTRSLITMPMAPMAVGGSECPKCTLINEKSVKICEACGASLTNSPTYI